MTDLQEIMAAVAGLPREGLAEFQRWFNEFAADSWDRQIEEHVRAGRLDHLAGKAVQEHAAGRTRKL